VSPATRTVDDAGLLEPLGLRWQPRTGQAVLTGALESLAAACERAFTVLAGEWNAEPETYPPMIDAAVLQTVDYLSSFPQLATFAVALDPGEENLERFTGRDPLDTDGAVRLTRTAPVRELLTPAACYHVYLHHQGAELVRARYLTTVNTCFRREAYYRPLRRQWSFRMREIVCLGTRAEVTAFLERARLGLDALLAELDLPVRWDVATDPFFQPARNPAYLAQRLHPTKHEALYGTGDGSDDSHGSHGRDDRDGDQLAIASVNLHEDHFGAAFAITREGRPAASGCLAFGLERWLYALVHRHGTDPAGWPDVVAAAGRAAQTLRATRADADAGASGEAGS
jgi:hypothetical protein